MSDRVLETFRVVNKPNKPRDLRFESTDAMHEAGLPVLNKLVTLFSRPDSNQSDPDFILLMNSDGSAMQCPAGAVQRPVPFRVWFRIYVVSVAALRHRSSC